MHFTAAQITLIRIATIAISRRRKVALTYDSAAEAEKDYKQTGLRKLDWVFPDVSVTTLTLVSFRRRPHGEIILSFNACG